MPLPDGLKFDANRLIPAIVQDHANGEVLMFAWMNAESLRITLESGYCTYWSRSRGKLWIKGETSGHKQRVVKVSVDCDQDCLLFQVEQVGAACHENFRSCFYRDLEPDGNLRVNAERIVE